MQVSFCGDRVQSSFFLMLTAFSESSHLIPFRMNFKQHFHPFYELLMGSLDSGFPVKPTKA